MTNDSTTSTAPTVDARATRAEAAFRTAVASARRWVVSGHAVVGSGYWAVVVLAAVVVPLIVRAVAGAATFSLMVGVAYSAPWVVFSVTIAVVSQMPGMHLGAGGTRRSMHRGVVQALALTGAAYGACYGLALLAERAYVEGLGLRWTVPGGLGTFAGGLGLTALGEVFVVVVYSLVGATVVALFQAGMRPVRTVGSLALTALFLPAVEMATRSGVAGEGATAWLADHVGLDGRVAVVVGLALALGLVVLASAWYWHHLRTLQLRPPS